MNKITYQAFKSKYSQPNLFGESHAPPTLEVHKVENNPTSQEYLIENQLKIKKSCRKVLDLLVKGVHLTVNGAVMLYGISSLPRRIKDLRDDNGIKINDVKIKGQQATYIEYFMDLEERLRLKEIYKP